MAGTCLQVNSIMDDIIKQFEQIQKLSGPLGGIIEDDSRYESMLVC